MEIYQHSMGSHPNSSFLGMTLIPSKERKEQVEIQAKQCVYTYLIVC